MWTLTYPGTIDRDDLIRRVLGPDMHGGLAFVDTVRYGYSTELPLGIPEGPARPETYAGVTVLPPTETRLTTDAFGQVRVAESATRLDPDGVVRLVPADAQ